MATNTGKDTIYIDIDDEITTIIDKLRASNEKIVALVLPKRASVLQSIVNMKLLKRAADQESKRAVLITAEAGLLPLAGTVGLYVAKSLQTKPEIPNVGPALAELDEIEADEPDDVEEITSANSGSRSVGELAGGTAVAATAGQGAEAIETLQLDDDLPADIELPDSKTSAAADKAKTKPKRDKKLGVPNFQRFRLILVLGGVLIITLIVGGVVAASLLPKATITVHTDTSNITSNLALNLDTTAKTLNAQKLIVPATLQKVDKTGSQQVAATGKKNNGTKASGKVTLSLSDCSVSQVTVPAGTGVSSNGSTFITQADANLQSVKVGSSCKNSQFPDFSSATVNVIAQAAGAQYNVAATTFKVSGYPSVAASSSDAMTGGTDNIIQVVAQSDIDNATQKITAQNSDAVKTQLQQQLKQAGLFGIDTTFVAGTPNTQSSAQVGDQVSTVSVTQTTTYSMFGVKEADLKTLVDTDIKDKIDPSKQSILSEGLSKASFKVNNASATAASVALATTAVAGPDLKVSDVKAQAAGKKSGQVQDALKATPGVTTVDVKLSPFWVTSVPHKADKVTVNFVKTQ